MRSVVPLALALVAGCASTPAGRVHQAALATKAFVDGVGQSYLAVCTETVRPRCVEEDRKAREAGQPQSEADRVACLKPCDSETASKVHTAVGFVRVAQLAVWRALATGAGDGEIQNADEDLKQSLDSLLELLQSAGVNDLMNLGRQNG
jgi:hypothetical protein